MCCLSCFGHLAPVAGDGSGHVRSHRLLPKDAVESPIIAGSSEKALLLKATKLRDLFRFFVQNRALFLGS